MAGSLNDPCRPCGASPVRWVNPRSGPAVAFCTLARVPPAYSVADGHRHFSDPTDRRRFNLSATCAELLVYGALIAEMTPPLQDGGDGACLMFVSQPK